MNYFNALRCLTLAVILFVSQAVFCTAQNTPGKMGKIAILPFTGGSSDEKEGIAELFSFMPQIMNR